jgi:hypothetical protein
MVDVNVASSEATATNSAVQQLQSGDPSVGASKYPTSPWLQLDTREDADKCLARALAYL